MSDQTIKLIAAGVLLLHGLGHGGALAALAWIRLRPGTPTLDWHAAQSWLVPSLPGDTATTMASASSALALRASRVAIFRAPLVDGASPRDAAAEAV